jgi:hypothetical protein
MNRDRASAHEQRLRDKLLIASAYRYPYVVPVLAYLSNLVSRGCSRFWSLALWLFLRSELVCTMATVPNVLGRARRTVPQEG